MRDLWDSISCKIRSSRTDSRGGAALTFALSAPVLLGAIALAVDYSDLSTRRQRLQQLADAAALAGAREMRLGSQSADVVTAIAQSYVESSAKIVTNSSIAFTGDISGDKASFSVSLSAEAPFYIAKSLGVLSTTIAARATARLTSGPPICVVGLDTNSNSTIDLNNSAKMMGNGCSVFSNSGKPQGIHTSGGALLQSSYTCTAGGFGGGGVFSPSPKTGCPVTVDPLKDRAAPSVPACDASKTDLTINGGSTLLYPGIYCGGLKITNGAAVTLSAGTYIIKDGQLRVDGGSTVSGSYVGLYFTGNNASLRFDAASTIDLTGPKDGVMVGMLMFQDRSSNDQTFQIDSNNAARLIGTVYLPKGELRLTGSQPVGQSSAFTIVIAKTIKIGNTASMVLNTQYNATDVPVPLGVGSNSGAVALVN